ncbi:MAG: helix-turn-helix domain-containing protein [Nannocystaceae bacterium]
MPIPLYRLEVSKGAKLVLSYLWRYAGREPFVWVDRETIASDVGVESERTLRRLLGELRKAGVIEEAVEVRHGRARAGWWLRDGRDVAGGDVGGGLEAARDGGGEAEEGGGLEQEGERDGGAGLEQVGRDGDEGVGEADRTDRGRPKLAAGADRNGRVRTKLAARAAKNGRSFSLELPGNQSSLCDPPGSLGSASGGASEQDRVRAELARLRRWRGAGGDPEGLGAWPTPTPPGGVALPRLAMGGKLAERLREERTAEEVHRAVHLVGELVEAGELKAEKWRATYVFSGWLDELVVKAVELRGRRERKEQRKRESRRQPEPSRLSRDEMIETLAELRTLQPVARSLRALPRESTICRAGGDRDMKLELLDLRIEIQAVAEQLGQEPEDLLRFLGRTSTRDLRIEDRERLRALAADRACELSATGSLDLRELDESDFDGFLQSGGRQGAGFKD